MTENYTFLIFLSYNVSPAQASQPTESKGTVTVEIKKVSINKANNCKLWNGILKVCIWEIKCFSAHQKCNRHLLSHTDYFISSTSILSISTTRGS